MVTKVEETGYCCPLELEDKAGVEVGVDPCGAAQAELTPEVSRKSRKKSLAHQLPHWNVEEACVSAGAGHP